MTKPVVTAVKIENAVKSFHTTEYGHTTTYLTYEREDGVFVTETRIRDKNGECFHENKLELFHLENVLNYITGYDARELVFID
jgi:hypothetical protein